MQIERYIPPALHPLHAYVESIFAARGRYSEELILPKGNVDLLFNLGDPIRADNSAPHADSMTWRKGIVVGLQTEQIVSKPQGTVSMVGVSLRAATCRAVIPLPLNEITDRTVDAAVLFPEANLLWEQLGNASSFQHQCRVLTDWLHTQLDPPSRAELIREACQAFDAHPDGISVDRIVEASAVSPRQLRRLFREHVGVPPARYLRLSRFIKALHLITTPLTLTEIAHEARYYDQAHFCRDFRAISGITPAQYREKTGPVPGHVFSP